MDFARLTGLIAATYTPLNERAQLKTDVVPAMVDHLIQQGLRGLYVCGSTGEGMSLSSADRKAVTESYVQAAAGRVPVIVQVGHNSLDEARELAAHAAQCGAEMISATCPSYFKVTSVDALVDSMQVIASGAPELPFYYYHIPALTGSAIDMPEFLQLAGKRIPNLVGIKYTAPTLFEFQMCQSVDGGRFDIVWGCDEMLLGAYATGAQAGIGSTYNVAPALYRNLVDAIEQQKWDEARRLQLVSIEMIRTIGRYPFHPAMRCVLGFQGFDVGDCLLPQPKLSEQQAEQLRSDLHSIGFFDWAL